MVSNYRPISLLAIVSKVTERCFRTNSSHRPHLFKALSALIWLSQGKIHTSQLLQIPHAICELLDNIIQTDTIYLDFAKAFHIVDYQLLLTELQRFGITGTLLKSFEDYLTGCSQRVLVLGV